MEKNLFNEEILYIGGFLLPDKNAAAHRVLNNARAFRKIGLNTVFIDVDKNLSHKNHFLNNYKEIDGFKCFSISYANTFYSSLKVLISIKVIKEAIKKFPNIKYLICYNYQSIALYRLNKLCIKKDIRIISDCTEGYFFNKKANLISLAKSFDDYFRIIYVQPKLNGLILISKSSTKYCYHKSNLIVIPPLVDKSEKKWEEDTFHYNIQSDSKINLVYAGNLGSCKDKICNLIHYLDKLNNYRFEFKIIGIDKCEFVKRYPNFVDILDRLKNVVYFMGKMSNSNVIKELKKSDFLIFFRDKNQVSEMGFPTKFVESISAGIPVITNDTSDIKLYITSGVNGFIINDNNFEDELNEIFSKSIKELKNMKRRIDRNIFDYNNHLKDIKIFFECI